MNRDESIAHTPAKEKHYRNIFVLCITINTSVHKIMVHFRVKSFLCVAETQLSATNFHLRHIKLVSSDWVTVLIFAFVQPHATFAKCNGK